MNIINLTCLIEIYVLFLSSFMMNKCCVVLSRDRFRTMTNVVGDSIGAGIVYHLSKNELSGDNEDKTENLNLVRVDIPNGKDAITAV